MRADTFTGKGGGRIARRILLVFGATWLAFAITAAFSLHTLRRNAAETEVLTRGLVPVALQLAQLRSTQTTITALVDGLPDERDAAAAKHVLSTLVRERSAKLAATTLALNATEGISGSHLRASLGSELTTLSDVLATDEEPFETLYVALREGNRNDINRAIVDLGRVEHDATRRVRNLDERANVALDQVTLDASSRVRRSVLLLIAFATATLTLGVLVSLRTRAWLMPLGALTARAQAVARGDLQAQPTTTRRDELGELENTFEQMVAAVASAKDEAVVNERFAAIGKMAAHVTHEIRNPLTSMALNIDLLEEELAESTAAHAVGSSHSSQEAQKLAAAIRREVARLEHLSEEYLGLARVPTARQIADDLVRIAEDLANFEQPEMVRAQCTLTFTSEEVPPVLCDEAQIRQALLNLIRNAREAVTCMPASIARSVKLDVRASGLSVIVTVEDNGAGIPQATRERIFEPFFSTKGRGTGLGLAITKQIVEAHGGSIRVSPRTDGTGTVFRLEFPFAPLATDPFEREKLAGQRS
jgi:two-component system, NtrC family, sensor kinase